MINSNENSDGNSQLTWTKFNQVRNQRRRRKTSPISKLVRLTEITKQVKKFSEQYNTSSKLARVFKKTSINPLKNRN